MLKKVLNQYAWKVDAQAQIRALVKYHTIHKIHQSPKEVIASSHYSVKENAWYFTNCESLYKINHTNKVVKLFDIDEAYNIYENDKLYVIHSNGYSIIENVPIRITFDKNVIGLSKQNHSLYLHKYNEMSHLDLKSGEILNFNVQREESILIGVDINLKPYKVSICGGFVFYKDKQLEIPQRVCGENVLYNFELANERTIVIHVYNEFCTWYIKLDMQSGKFGDWICTKFINRIISLQIPKVLLEYDSMLLILSYKDFDSLLSGKPISDLLFEIDNGNDSMVYYRDNTSIYCISDDNMYVYYIHNNKLMVTSTIAPYSMHVICELNNNVVHMDVCTNEIFIQYKNLDLILIKI